jgi:hypothetical protein
MSHHLRMQCYYTPRWEPQVLQEDLGSEQCFLLGNGQSDVRQPSLHAPPSHTLAHWLILF